MSLSDAHGNAGACDLLVLVGGFPLPFLQRHTVTGVAVAICIDSIIRTPRTPT